MDSGRCGGGKHSGSGSVRVLFRAGHCTHSWGKRNENRIAVSRGTDQHGNVSFFFCLFFQLLPTPPPNPSPMLMRSRIRLCPGTPWDRYVTVAHLPSLSSLTSLPTCPHFHPPHALTHTVPFVHYTPCTPACTPYPCPCLCSMPTPQRHPLPPTTPMMPMPSSTCPTTTCTDNECQPKGNLEFNVCTVQ